MITLNKITYFEIREFVLANGKSPFGTWLKKLDRTTKEKVEARVLRMGIGNVGDCKSLGGNLFEARIHFRAGYRIYFGIQKQNIILLLLGGNKSTQKKDILKAKAFWKMQLKGRNNG